MIKRNNPDCLSFNSSWQTNTQHGLPQFILNNFAYVPIGDHLVNINVGIRKKGARI